MGARQKTAPYSLNATATHDTKRGEDVRIRLNVLSEIPDQVGGKCEKMVGHDWANF